MRGALSDSGLGALKKSSRKSFKKFQRSQKVSILFHGYPASKICAERNISTIAKQKVRNPDPRLGAARATSRPKPNAGAERPSQIAWPRDSSQTRPRAAPAH